jgi:trans-2-enoyl-CoA reductase
VSALQIREFGKASEVLEWEENVTAARVLDEDEVRVKILASPINPADLNWIEGTYGTRPVLPAVPGTEAVGEVVESRVPSLVVGTRVILLSYAHGWQQQRVLHRHEVLPVPKELSIFDAAMLKVNPATAWRMLHDFVNLPKGAVLLQNAANSGVGRCVIQIARACGWRTINFVRNPETMTELQELGADLVCTDDEEGKQRALAYLNQHGERAMLAFNAVGGESAMRQFDLMKDGGVQVTYGAMGRRPVSVPNQFLIFRDVCCRGFWLSRWLSQASAAEITVMYEKLMELILMGGLKQPVDRMLPLSDFAYALERLKASDRRGKVLFVPDA